MNPSTPFATIRNHCDNAISAVQRLEDVKNMLLQHEAEHQTKTKSLEDDVSALRTEKEKIKADIVKLQNLVSKLDRGLTGTRNHVVGHVYTITAAGGSSLNDDDASDITTPDDADNSNNKQGVSTNTHNDDSADSSDDDTNLLEQEDSFFETTPQSIGTQPPQSTDVYDTTNEHFISITPRLLDATFSKEDTYMAPSDKCCNEENQSSSLVSIDAGVSTSSLSRLSKTSSSKAKRRRCQKANPSPKKWRRMIRSQRLQSILLSN